MKIKSARRRAVVREEAMGVEVTEYPFLSDRLRLAGEWFEFSRYEKAPITRKQIEEAIGELRLPIKVLEPVHFHLFRQSFGPMGRHILYAGVSHVLLSPPIGTKFAYSTPVHELGHAFVDRYLKGKWWEEYAGLAPSRVPDCAAEDFRFIFGGPRAREENHKERGGRPTAEDLENVVRIFMGALLDGMERREPLSITLRIGDPSLIVNGKRVLMDAEPFIKNGRTFVPVRFIAEALGCSVEWNHESKQVSICRR